MNVGLLRQASLAACAMAALAPGAAAAQGGDCNGSPTGVKVVVKVENIRAAEGLMAVTFYDDEKKFLKSGGSIRVLREPARAGSQSICYWVPRPGSYAVVVYQDLNSNHKFGYNWLTGPNEPWGLTNNPHSLSLLNLPKFNQVKFEAHQGDNVVQVTLNYPK
ncbi:MAG: DUF2141 domain-containing protein [Proteobacteria bacterium]|nr:DUF2141 domain-containing protein [Pseudomonadota bacterium]